MNAPAFDPVVEQVRAKLLARSQAGISKYGVTLERGDLSRLDWLRHAQEEALDFANYLQVLINEEEKAVCGDSTSRAGAPSTTPAPELPPPDVRDLSGQFFVGYSSKLMKEYAAKQAEHFAVCLRHTSEGATKDASSRKGADTDRHGSNDPKDCR